FTHRSFPFVREEEIERLRRKGENRPANTQSTTICLGKYLIIHALSSAVGKSLVRRWPLPADISRAVSQVWPIRSTVVTWPPSDALTDSGIHFLANQFADAAHAILASADG